MKTKQPTKEQIRRYALSRGLDLCGFAAIERFDGAPKDMHPARIFPECRTVIVVGKQILHGGWRGVEEGTYWPTYTHFDYHGLLNTYFIPLGLYETACWLEDRGWEAVPYYPGVPETQRPAKAPGKAAPAGEVQLAIRIAGLAAGLGEIGWSKVFLTPEFGPRQRLAAIFTDLELESDPLVKPGTLCKMDMACVAGCPGAIPHVKEGRTVEIRIEDQVYRWADVDMGRCTLMYHGGDPRVSPFIHKSFPGYEFDVMKQDFTEEEAYKFCWPMSINPWRPTPEFPEGYIIEGHAYLQKWGIGGSYGVEGSRGCMRSCFNYMEGRKLVKRRLRSGAFIRRPRWLLDKRTASRPPSGGK